ncbi:MAG: hypothetical protein M1814_003528 [Vezdaea aestivalis]|nr:MAG: hypothetical protein M1814_003528 [Vezdaea aestivalis]
MAQELERSGLAGFENAYASIIPALYKAGLLPEPTTEDALVTVMKHAKEYEDTTEGDKTSLWLLHSLETKWRYHTARGTREIAGEIYTRFLSACEKVYGPKNNPDNRRDQAASRRGLESIVAIMIDFGAAVDAKNEQDQVSLHFAVQSGNTEIIRRLLVSWPKSLYESDMYGQTPFVIGLTSGSLETRNVLLFYDVEDIGIEESFQSAMNAGNQPLLATLLEPGFAADFRMRDGYTLLSHVSAMGKDTISEFLLHSGADPNSRGPLDRTHLICAAALGHDAIVKQLLLRGAVQDARDKLGRTALSHAAGSGHQAVVDMLVQNPAVIETKDSLGLTPFLWAARCGQGEAIRTLLQHGADIKSSTKTHATALCKAAEYGRSTTLELLIMANAEKEVKFIPDLDESVRVKRITPLLCATFCGYADVVDKLLRHGARANFKDYFDRSSLYLAAKTPHR